MKKVAKNKSRHLFSAGAFFATCFLALLLAACASSSDRPLAPGDLMFGKFPATETALRMKAPCPVAGDDGATYILPAGDYKPVSADASGLFYQPPVATELRRGERSNLLFGMGAYFPYSGSSVAQPYFWSEGVSLERGTASRVKRWPLPATCWRPYGETLVILHKGAEIAPR